MNPNRRPHSSEEEFRTPDAALLQDRFPLFDQEEGRQEASPADGNAPDEEYDDEYDPYGEEQPTREGNSGSAPDDEEGGSLYGKAQHPIEEEEILRLLANPQTKESAFSQIVKAYAERLYWVIRHIVNNHQDTNDLLQNTLLKAWTNIHAFRGEAKLYTWLYRIALYEALSFVKKQRTQQALFLSPGEVNDYTLSVQSRDPYFDGDAAEAKLQKAVAALPEKQQLVFSLRYYNEMPYEEIAQITGTSVGALKANYHHAAAKIKEYLLQEH